MARDWSRQLPAGGLVLVFEKGPSLAATGVWASARAVCGLLIGADARAHVQPGDTVHLLADAVLGALYSSAIRSIGGQVVAIDSHAAFIAGIIRLWELAP